MGVAYEKGIGAEKNLKEAVRWYRLAAERGHGVSIANLALCYQFGKGVLKDDHEAVRWHRRAASFNFVSSFFSLARYYNFGFGGFPEDKIMAAWLFHLADQQGHPRALDAFTFVRLSDVCLHLLCLGLIFPGAEVYFVCHYWQRRTE
jgi:TPR repeat protein